MRKHGWNPFENENGSDLAVQAIMIAGRGAGIRTRDPLHPMQVRYQAAPHPDCVDYSTAPKRLLRLPQQFENRFQLLANINVSFAAGHFGRGARGGAIVPL